MSSHEQRVRPGQAGFALILALLALMLLTVLGLTLATTTTTEVQIAANYRYSRQALYNAEAGMQAARYVLASLAQSGGTVVTSRLPTVRPGPWAESSADNTPFETTMADTTLGALGDYYPQRLAGSVVGCDTRGRIGYGRILLDGLGAPMRELTTWGGQGLLGGFTIWIRRPLVSDVTGQFTDSTAPDLVTVTVMGTAPFAGKIGWGAQNQAVRVLEQTLKLTTSGTSAKPCGSGIYQTGRDQLGTNFDPCSTLDAGGVASFVAGWGRP